MQPAFLTVMRRTTSEPPSLMDDGNFLLELDKIGTGPAPGQTPQRRGFWAAENSSGADDDLGDVPNFDAAETPGQIARDADEPGRDIDADSETVPNYLAALVILLCTCVGASGAVLALHDRVQQIVAAWTIAAR
jgi:hypothetical protein